MINITDSILQAKANGASWANNLFFACNELFENSGFSISFWEGEERWATIAMNESIVGYLWRRYPLLLVAESQASDIHELLKEVGIVCQVTINKLDEKVLTANTDVLQDVELSVEIPFSAEDVWFYNNSL